MTRILLKDATVVTMDAERRVFDGGFVLIADGRIAAVGEMSDLPHVGDNTAALHLGGKVVLPGLVNMHNHPCASLLKATGRGLLLEDWIPSVALPMISHLDNETLELASRYQTAEMLLSGTTTCMVHTVNINDAESLTSIARPAADLGIRQIVTKELRHAPDTPMSPHLPSPSYPRGLEEELALAESIVRQWNGASGGLVRAGLAIEAGATWLLSNATSEDIILRGEELARQLSVPISCHISATPFRAYREFVKRTGMGEIEYLAKLGCLSDRWIFVHSLNLMEREVALVATAGASVAHCPVSNAYAADGVAPLPGFLASNVDCGLGTDGAYACGSTDMFEVMKFCSLLHNVLHHEPALVTAERVLEMATIGGARALGMDSEIGSLEVGKRADIIVLDLTTLDCSPVTDLPASLVHCARGVNVCDVIVDGKHVVKDRVIGGVSIRELVDEAQAASRALLDRAELDWLRTAWGSPRTGVSRFPSDS